MQIVRIYTGDDGESHFEELELPFEAVANAERTAAQSAASVTFSRMQPGAFSDWHTAPRRQYVITLAGQMEIGLGDGTKRLFNPGDVLLADDLTGRGHTTAASGNQIRISVAIPITD